MHYLCDALIRTRTMGRGCRVHSDVVWFLIGVWCKHVAAGVLIRLSLSFDLTIDVFIISSFLVFVWWSAAMVRMDSINVHRTDRGR